MKVEFWKIDLIIPFWVGISENLMVAFRYTFKGREKKFQEVCA